MEYSKNQAIEKLIDAAVKHDRRMCGPAGLKGFDGATLTPKVFREQIKRTFQIYKACTEEKHSFLLYDALENKFFKRFEFEVVE